MKKWIIILLIILLLVALLTICITGGFTKNILTGKIYHPQNVYEEIWNLVVAEEFRAEQTVLTTSTNNAAVDFDLGIDFVSIHIPDCNVSIGWRSTNGNTELSFLFSSRVDGDVDRIHFLYNYETKTLFGDTEFSYLLENFLVDYFQWCENSTDFSSNYSVESLGDIPFQYINPIWKRELSG